MPKPTMNDLGLHIQQTVRFVDPKQYDNIRKSHLHARSAGRMLEEAVELALIFGLPPADILKHVMDAIYNEAKKAGVYPSNMKPLGDTFDRLQELADMVLQIEHLCQLAGISHPKLEDHAIGKAVKLREWVEAKQMVMVDGLMYRRSVRG